MNGQSESVSRRWEEKSSKSASLWLQTIPLKSKPRSILSRDTFCDAVRLRFNMEPKNLPTICPAQNCRTAFSVEHSDICTAGTTTIHRHNHIRDILASYAEKAFGSSSTSLEPTLGRIDENSGHLVAGNNKDQARADICIRGLINPQIDVFLDVAVISPSCQSNVNYSVSWSVKARGRIKRNAYQDRIQKQLAGDFYPVVFSSGGMIGETARSIINTIANKLSSKTDEDNKKASMEIKSEISFSLIRSRINSLRNPKRSIHEQLRVFNSHS